MKRILAILMIIMVSSQVPFIGTTDAANEDRIAELRKQIEDLEHEAEQYRDNIASERAKAASLKTEIAALKNEISRLEAQINATSKKIDKTKLEITGIEGSIFDTHTTIERRKETVGELLVFLSQRDSENLLTTLMKNQSLSSFLTQAQEVDSVNNQLLGLISELKDKKTELENAKKSLEGKKTELISLNQEHSARKLSLLDVKSNRDTVLTQTKGQEAQYQKMLNDIEARKTQFFLELQKLENSIIAGGNYIVRVKAQNLPPKGTNIFAWPEGGYRLTQGYGMTTYAKRGAYGGAPHNGLDIAGGFGTPIMSIGAGQILANGFNSGFGNWVAVQHPPYNLVSVYGHMSSLAPLSVGTEVKQGQVIGYEGSTGNSTGSHLHLSLYKEFFTYQKSGQLYFNYFEGSINPNDYLP
jgi:murein DD-endopeptidase MepM/ murein hydrolase activator NlpD